jgi:Protein of unknown function (DUF3365)
MSRMHLGALVAIVILAGTPARAQAPPREGSGQAREWPTYPVAQAPAEWQPALRHGDLIIVSLNAALQQELRRDLAAGGPAGAMAACHIDTTAAAYRAAREEGIAAGRTSAALRNPTNAPRPWAAAIVARYAGRPATGIDGFGVDLGDRIGLLRPIVQQTTCEPCHGPEQKLDRAVLGTLKDRYPADRATGFKTGDLRGWFWVELPKR